MVSSDTVGGALNELSSSLKSYCSYIDALASSWQGDSYLNLTSRANEFVSQFSSVISGEMEAFASACNLYQQYVNAKNNYNISVNNYNAAVANNDTSRLASFQSDINRFSNEINQLKQNIETCLSTASSTKLDASRLNIGGSSSSFVKTGGMVGSNPNLIYSDSGYVFPFEKGVDAPVSSSVGNRSQPTAGASTNHKGTDIAVPVGTEVHSLSSGTVVNAGRSDAGGFGNWVRVQQDDGNYVIYGHVSKSDFYQVGDRVEAGDVVALSGNEGVSTGPHLHLQINSADGTVLNSEYIFQDCWPS